MTAPSEALELDVLIFGGGVAGLWLLDELHRRGFAVALVESKALGTGQTICSQGILHGGLKYALGGIVADSSKAVREMPAHWAACLAGQRQPDLRSVRVLSPHCHLWRTDSLASRVGLWGARAALQTPVEKVADADRPAALAHCPGQVFRVNEPVIAVAAFLTALAERHRSRMFLAPHCTIAATSAERRRVEQVELHHADTKQTLAFRPAWIVLTAGEGNESLRRTMGLDAEVMQRRPLHMVLVRGDLPDLFGHCVDGNKTRMTITSARDRAGRTVWQLGGELAEQGVARDPSAQLAAAKVELNAVLPGLNLRGVEWACYRVDRAEGRMSDGRRPDGPQIRVEGNVITAWPTKLVLAPRLAETIAEKLGGPKIGATVLPDWPRPAVADPPWEVTTQWHS